MTQVCTKCWVRKPIGAFGRWNRTRHGRQYQCKECRNLLYRKLYSKNVAHRRAMNSARRLKLRLEWIEAYGGCCSCCKEKEARFLTLQHIGGGGSRERKVFHTTFGIIAMLKRLGWPKNNHTILCANCNMATMFGDSCPHETQTIVRS